MLARISSSTTARKALNCYIDCPVAAWPRLNSLYAEVDLSNAENNFNFTQKLIFNKSDFLHIMLHIWSQRKKMHKNEYKQVVVWSSGSCCNAVCSDYNKHLEYRYLWWDGVHESFPLDKTWHIRTWNQLRHDWKGKQYKEPWVPRVIKKIAVSVEYHSPCHMHGYVLTSFYRGSKGF